ncbi:discoidin domain-containing protein [Bacteroides sp.]|uniref:discoidin domain-containing protein n=1 Tax=Bacteroides sp. TaxID=29523 RepID=UPI0025C6F120|nr:discoidin domain-containing protein [Bacteroides sp.]
MLVVALTMGCDDRLEPFEYTGSSEIPAAIEVEKVKSEALPGQIRLTWAAPEGEFAYMQIKYFDPLLKKEVYKIASKGTTQLLIDNTRARYGDYSFSFQTFNSVHQGGEAKFVKAKSGKAPTTTTVVSKTKIPLTADQLSTNNQEPTEGPIKNLLDGNSGTMFHTRWSSPQIEMPQWIQVNLKEAHETFLVYYMNRNDSWTTSARPSVVELQISNDGKVWETIATLSGLPSAASAEYTSPYVIAGRKFTYFRFNVMATSGNTKYFNMAEFAMYDVVLKVHNPETDEKE